MSGSLVVACKRALISLLQDRPGLNGVQVTYGYAGTGKIERERIYCGRSRADTPQAALKAGRRFRDEDATFDLVIQVEKVGGTPEDAEDRALELGLEVEECVADNKYLGDPPVPGLNWAVVDGWQMFNAYNDRGAVAELIYTIHYRGRLT